MAARLKKQNQSQQELLSGSIVFSTGTVVPVCVLLDLPSLARSEQRELQNSRVPLHDLTPGPARSRLHAQSCRASERSSRGDETRNVRGPRHAFKTFDELIAARHKQLARESNPDRCRMMATRIGELYAEEALRRIKRSLRRGTR